MNSSHPLYRAAGHYPLRSIREEDWLLFIRKRFLDADKKISDEEVQSICRLTEGHPFYTQHLCHVIWELCEAKSQVTEDMIESAVDILLDRESYAYTALWESLARNQRRFLYGLARERNNIKPYAADFIQPYGLSSASSVQRVIEALLGRDIIDRDNDSFIITDRFFSIWIRRL